MRAKFRVYQENISLWSITYVLNPVIDGSKENEEFFATTPSGEITIVVKKDVTSARLETGKDYYIDFTEAT